MSDLLQLAVQAHGGERRWAEVTRFTTAASITGAIWALKGKADVLAEVVLAGETTEQRLTISGFPGAGRRTSWTPGRETIETLDGEVLDQRNDPASSFAGHTRQTPWDDFHVAYFAGEANWNYFVAPFLFTRPDFTTRETEPWVEDGEKWRALVVTYPDAVVAHSREQTYYFDQEGLLRRLDYRVDILGGGPAVHYPSEYREFDGIMVPTRRRVYVRNPDGSPNRESVSIAIDFSDVRFR